jgi:serine acetyltransferase
MLIDYDEFLKVVSHEVYGGIVAIGDNWKRSKMVSDILLSFSDFRFIKAIHPNAVIGKNVSINNGTVIMANTVIK